MKKQKIIKFQCGCFLARSGYSSYYSLTLICCDTHKLINPGIDAIDHPLQFSRVLNSICADKNNFESAKKLILNT